MPGWPVSDKSWWELELDWKRMESSWKVDGKKLEKIGEVARTIGVGGNARSRGKCQAGQCLIRVDRNWNEIGNSWKVYGKKLEIIGEFARCGWGWMGRQ